MLRLEQADLSVSGKKLLESANVSISPGNRIGIIGRNGSGKTHLLAVLAGNQSLDGGKRILAEKITVCLVKQELPGDDKTPLEYLRDNDPELAALNAAIDAASVEKLGDIYAQLSELEEERYEKLAPSVLIGLGLSPSQLKEPMRNLSGGLRMRIGLSMALIRQPKVLLLDEPTNHLDLESTQWLIEYLKAYPKSCAFIIVTHDIKLLAEVTETTMHLRGGKLTEFGGDYHAFKDETEMREEKDKQKNIDLDKKIAKKTAIYYRFRDLPEARAAQAVAQLKKAAELKSQKVEIVAEESVIEIKFPEPAAIINPVIKLVNVNIGYGSHVVLKNLDLSIQFGSRIGLLGRNGEGKTSLIKVLAGMLKPLAGIVDDKPRLKIGYFSQELTDVLDVKLTVQEQFNLSTGIKKEEESRSALAKFGLGSRDKINVLVGNLSGGEKSRLLFALICARAPNLLILDEPTNHLDVETRVVLVEAMNEFKGSIILVSHDWDLHEQTMKEFWLARNGTVKPYVKGLQQYQKELEVFIKANLHSQGKASNTSSAPSPSKQSTLVVNSSSIGAGKKPAKSGFFEVKVADEKVSQVKKINKINIKK